MLFFSGIVSNASANSIDSLLETIQTSKNHLSDLELANLYIKIGSQLHDDEKYSEALVYRQKAWELLPQDHESVEKYKLIADMASAQRWLNNFQEALELYTEFISSPAEYTEQSEKANALSQMSAIYKNLGDYELAYDYCLKAIGLFEAMRDTSGLATSHYELGSLFYYQDNFQQALEQYRIAEKLFNQVEGSRGVYSCAAAIGTTYESLGDLEKSLEYNKRSLLLAENMNYRTGIAYSLTNIGTNYMHRGDFERARNFLRRSITLKKEANDRWGQIGTFRHMADLELRASDPEQSLIYLDSAFILAEGIGSKTRMISLLELYADIHRDLGNFEKALDYTYTYVQLRDSVLNETTLREMGQRQKRFEIQKREKEILLLKRENDLLESKKQIDKLYNAIFFATAVFLLIMLIMVINRFRTQKHTNELLEDKNKEINQKNEELQQVNELVTATNALLGEKNIQIEQQNKRLEDSNEDLRNFASVASHDLKEPLRMINAYTKILNKRYQHLFDENANEFMGYIVDAVSRMEGLLNGLLDYSRVSIGKDAQKAIIQTRDIIDLVKGNLKFSILKNEAEIKVDYDVLPPIRANQTQMVQLFQNLMSNAIKFRGERKPVITVNCCRRNQEYLFTIQDNGIGISDENREKIFEMFRRLHTKEEYEGTGIGLATCKKIVERHGGRIWVESEAGQGSTFFFTLPVVKELENAPSA